MTADDYRDVVTSPISDVTATPAPVTHIGHLRVGKTDTAVYLAATAWAVLLVTLIGHAQPLLHRLPYAAQLIVTLGIPAATTTALVVILKTKRVTLPKATQALQRLAWAMFH